MITALRLKRSAIVLLTRSVRPRCPRRTRSVRSTTQTFHLTRSVRSTTQTFHLMRSVRSTTQALHLTRSVRSTTRCPRRARSARSTTAPRGFTLLEITITSGLTVFLAILLSSVWGGIEKFTADAIGRGQLVQEIDFAVASLSRDLGGGLPVMAAQTFIGGKPDHDRWIGWQHPDDTELWLCFDGGTCPDGAADWSGTTASIIRYALENDPDPNAATKVLVREDRSVSPARKFVAARNLEGMSVEDEENFIKITLRFKFQQRSGGRYFGPEYQRTIVLKAKAPA